MKPKIPKVGDWFEYVGDVKKNIGYKMQVQSVEDHFKPHNSRWWCCIDFGDTGYNPYCNRWIYPNSSLRQCKAPGAQYKLKAYRNHCHKNKKLEEARDYLIARLNKEELEELKGLI